jgi:hypothetical protein
MSATYWQWQGFTAYRFRSKNLAERFAAYWPGYLGALERVPNSDPSLDPPVWEVITRSGRILFYVENRTVPIL